MTTNLTDITILTASIMPTEPDQNMAVSLALAGLAFMLTIIVGRPIVTFLRIKNIGKQVRIDGPKTQLWKTGTPTMGGRIDFTGRRGDHGSV